MAYLPFIVYAFDVEKAWRAAVCTAVVFWITVFFFWFARHCFPVRVRKEAFFFWLLVWAQAVWYLIKLEPLWVLSIFFLTPVAFLEEERKDSRVRIFSKVLLRYYWETSLAGFGFIGFTIVMALLQGVLVGRLGIQSFQQPAGVFLLLAAVALLWKIGLSRR